MEFNNIILKIEDSIATLRLNRPDALNALSVELLNEFYEATLQVKAKVALLKSVIMLVFGILALWYVIQNAMTGYVPSATPITIVGIFVLIGNVALSLIHI